MSLPTTKKDFAMTAVATAMAGLFLSGNTSSAFGQSAQPQSGPMAKTVSASASQLPFKILDVRGKGEAYAIALANSASQKGFAVLLIRGDDPDRRRNAEASILSAYESGRRKNVGLVIGDGNSNLWEIYAKGIRDEFSKVDAGLKTRAVITESLVDNYDKYIVDQAHTKNDGQENALIAAR